MNLEFVQYDVDQRVGYITLNRPDKRNALNLQMVDELKEAFSMAEESEDVKVVVLRANGQAFCAGADLAYLQQLQANTYEENLYDSQNLKELFHQIHTMSKVVIAQVNGFAVAGGCGLATVCDFSFAVPEAKFGYTEVKIGFIPAIVMIFLIRKIGEGKAKELLLTGNLIMADRALSMGLINEVVPADLLATRVEEFAQDLIKSNSKQSMGFTKQMIASVQSRSLDEALHYASEMNARARATDDCKRGISSFLDKKPVEW
jgi:methylglutaconyl-CoA hydratase